MLGGRGRRPNHYRYKQTTVLLLIHSEDRMILYSVMWVQYQYVTDRQIDRRLSQPIGNTRLAMYCRAQKPSLTSRHCHSSEMT